MRKSIILALAAAAFTLTSCDDFLDRDPRDTFTDTPAFWNNEKAVESYTNNFYNNFVGYGRGQGWFYFKSLSDDQAAASLVDWTYRPYLTHRATITVGSQKYVAQVMLSKTCLLQPCQRPARKNI